MSSGEAYAACLEAGLGRKGGSASLNHLRWHAGSGVTTTHKCYYGAYYEEFAQGAELWFGWLTRSPTL